MSDSDDITLIEHIPKRKKHNEDNYDAADDQSSLQACTHSRSSILGSNSQYTRPEHGSLNDTAHFARTQDHSTAPENISVKPTLSRSKRSRPSTTAKTTATAASFFTTKPSTAGIPIPTTVTHPSQLPFPPVCPPPTACPLATSWIELPPPSTLSSLCVSANRCKEFQRHFEAALRACQGGPPAPRVVLVSGAAGTGKRSLVSLVASLHGLRVVELGAPEVARANEVDHAWEQRLHRACASVGNTMVLCDASWASEQEGDSNNECAAVCAAVRRVGASSAQPIVVCVTCDSESNPHNAPWHTRSGTIAAMHVLPPTELALRAAAQRLCQTVRARVRTWLEEGARWVEAASQSSESGTDTTSAVAAWREREGARRLAWGSLCWPLGPHHGEPHPPPHATGMVDNGAPMARPERPKRLYAHCSAAASEDRVVEAFIEGGRADVRALVATLQQVLTRHWTQAVASWLQWHIVDKDVEVEGVGVAGRVEGSAVTEAAGVRMGAGAGAGAGAGMGVEEVCAGVRALQLGVNRGRRGRSRALLSAASEDEEEDEEANGACSLRTSVAARTPAPAVTGAKVTDEVGTRVAQAGIMARSPTDTRGDSSGGITTATTSTRTHTRTPPPEWLAALRCDEDTTAAGAAGVDDADDVDTSALAEAAVAEALPDGALSLFHVVGKLCVGGIVSLDRAHEPAGLSATTVRDWAVHNGLQRVHAVEDAAWWLDAVSASDAWGARDRVEHWRADEAGLLLASATNRALRCAAGDRATQTQRQAVGGAAVSGLTFSLRAPPHSRLAGAAALLRAKTMLLLLPSWMWRGSSFAEQRGQWLLRAQAVLRRDLSQRLTSGRVPVSWGNSPAPAGGFCLRACAGQCAVRLSPDALRVPDADTNAVVRVCVCGCQGGAVRVALPGQTSSVSMPLMALAHPPHTGPTPPWQICLGAGAREWLSFAGRQARALWPALTPPGDTLSATNHTAFGLRQSGDPVGQLLPDALVTALPGWAAAWGRGGLCAAGVFGAAVSARVDCVDAHVSAQMHTTRARRNAPNAGTGAGDGDGDGNGNGFVADGDGGERTGDGARGNSRHDALLQDCRAAAAARRTLLSSNVPASWVGASVLWPPTPAALLAAVQRQGEGAQHILSAAEGSLARVCELWAALGERVREAENVQLTGVSDGVDDAIDVDLGTLVLSPSASTSTSTAVAQQLPAGAHSNAPPTADANHARRGFWSDDSDDGDDDDNAIDSYGAAMGTAAHVDSVEDSSARTHSVAPVKLPATTASATAGAFRPSLQLGLGTLAMPCAPAPPAAPASHALPAAAGPVDAVSASTPRQTYAHNLYRRRGAPSASQPSPALGTSTSSTPMHTPAHTPTVLTISQGRAPGIPTPAAAVRLTERIPAITADTVDSTAPATQTHEVYSQTSTPAQSQIPALTQGQPRTNKAPAGMRGMLYRRRLPASSSTQSRASTQTISQSSTLSQECAEEPDKPV